MDAAQLEKLGVTVLNLAGGQMFALYGSTVQEIAKLLPRIPGVKLLKQDPGAKEIALTYLDQSAVITVNRGMSDSYSYLALDPNTPR